MQPPLSAACALLLLATLFSFGAAAQQKRTLSGTVVTPQFELVPGAAVEVSSPSGSITAITDREGRFSLLVPNEALSVTVSGRTIARMTMDIAADQNTTNLQIKISYIVPPITESVTITADSLTPQIELRNSRLYQDTLFSRDDQIIQTLNAGINAGQHEGGGKSLEIRRYGFNLDHGGVNGGLKILVDNVQQNQGTQGHGQGYLGSLKSLSPELVDSVSIINGPFSAAYGDFSGLGVVQIRQRESLSQQVTARLQGGSFNSFRGFFAYSPSWKNVDGYIAYEPSYTDGPFLNKLKYRRDNLTGNLIYKAAKSQTIGFRFNTGRNDFTSSGQIPLDLVAQGELDRFGFIDPENGGKAFAATGTIYYRREYSSGAVLRADAFVSRSLFDLYSNFTFFTADPIYGDEIQQHDSRLQEGANLQYVAPYQLDGMAGSITLGANLHLNQINVGLYPSVARGPNRKFLPGNESNPDVLLTSANARVNNYAGYLQNELTLLGGHLRIETGVRLDIFSFDVKGFELAADRRDLVGRENDFKFQPKVSAALSPFDLTPVTFYANYGRGISSQDARGVVREPAAPKISTTDFFQAGVSYNGNRFSAVASGFLIDRSNEQVYIPDDGSIELAGASRSYGIETRASARVSRRLRLTGGLTRVIRAYYPGQFAADGSRLIVDSSPKIVANAGLLFSDIFGITGAVNWRHISSYRLDPDDSAIKASGHDIVDLAVSKRLSRRLELNLAVDNLLNKRYFETQNYFESRTCGSCEIRPRIHATPGYPFTITAGFTLRFGEKR